MTMKFAKVYVIRNLETESIFRTFGRKILNCELGVKNDDTIIIVFDDNTMNEIKNLNKNSMLVEFGDSIDTYVEVVGSTNKINYYGVMPAYIKLKANPDIMLTFKVPTYVPKQGFVCDFKTKTNNVKSIPSKYNMVYVLKNDCEKEVFAVSKIKSSNESLEFRVSYNNDIIDNTTLFYLIDKLLKL